MTRAQLFIKLSALNGPINAFSQIASLYGLRTYFLGNNTGWIFGATNDVDPLAAGIQSFIITNNNQTPRSVELRTELDLIFP